MNIKGLALTGVVATSLLLGACGKDMDKKEMNDQKMEQKMNDKSSMSDMKMMKGTFMGDKEMVEGTAMIKDGKLKLDNFKSSKGPDLHVYLTKNNDIKTGKKISAVDYDKAMQEFDLKGVNTEEYDTVTIYCDKAHVIFGSAKLK